MKTLEDYLVKLDEISTWVGPGRSRAKALSLAAADINPVRAMATQVKRGIALTEKQRELILILFKKYQRQLKKFKVDATNIDKIPLAQPLRKVEQVKSAYYLNDNKKFFLIKFNFDPKVVSKFNFFKEISAGTFRFNKRTKTWIVAATEINIHNLVGFLIKNEFQVDPTLIADYEEICKFRVEYKEKYFDRTSEKDSWESNGLVLTESGEIPYAPQMLMEYIKKVTDGMNERERFLYICDKAYILGLYFSKSAVKRLVSQFSKNIELLSHFIAQPFAVIPVMSMKNLMNYLANYIKISRRNNIILIADSQYFGFKPEFRLENFIAKSFSRVKINRVDKLEDIAPNESDYLTVNVWLPAHNGLERFGAHTMLKTELQSQTFCIDINNRTKNFDLATTSNSLIQRFVTVGGTDKYFWLGESITNYSTDESKTNI